MTEEIKKYFWAITLDSNKKISVWDPECHIGPHGDTVRGDHRLSVKQIFLGAEINDTDVNIVEVQTRGFREQVIKFPIIITTKEKSIQVPLNFPGPPVEFHLVRGAGPLHLLGSHCIQTDDMDVDVVGMTTGAFDPAMELVVVDEEPDEQEKEPLEKENRKDNKRCFPQCNITKIRKKVKDAQK